jgi:hypothetical protein
MRKTLLAERDSEVHVEVRGVSLTALGADPDCIETEPLVAARAQRLRDCADFLVFKPSAAERNDCGLRGLDRRSLTGEPRKPRLEFWTSVTDDRQDFGGNSPYIVVLAA